MPRNTNHTMLAATNAARILKIKAARIIETTFCDEARISDQRLGRGRRRRPAAINANEIAPFKKARLAAVSAFSAMPMNTTVKIIWANENTAAIKRLTDSKRSFLVNNRYQEEKIRTLSKKKAAKRATSIIHQLLAADPLRATLLPALGSADSNHYHPMKIKRCL